MAKISNSNSIIVSFYGQSGAGKTTVIRSVPDKIGGCPVVKDTGVIRRLFASNPNAYRHPNEFLSQKNSIMGEANPGSLIAQMYEKYIRSQFQLLNDFSTEVFDSVRQNRTNKTYMLFDRCPMDFHAILSCGFEHLRGEFGGKVNRTHSGLLELERNTAIKNTINLFDVIFIVKPWTKPDTSSLVDGVRDQYLSSHYTGENWYSKLDGIDFGGTKIFVVDDSLTSIEGRVAYISDRLKMI